MILFQGIATIDEWKRLRREHYGNYAIRNQRIDRQEFNGESFLVVHGDLTELPAKTVQRIHRIRLARQRVSAIRASRRVKGVIAGKW